MIGPTIDMIWVGKLGAASIAGVGVAGMVVILLNSARMGLNTGTRAIIARFIGAGDKQGSNHVAQQAFIVSATFAIVMATIGILLTEPILILMQVEPDVIKEGADYMRIMFIGSAAMSFRMMSEGIMQSSGDVVTPMRIAIIFRVFHIILVPFLIFGWWIFPRLGVSGAAITNVISQSLGLAIGLWILMSGRTRLQLTLSNFRFNRNIIWRIVKIGIPTSLMGIQHHLCTLTLIRLTTPFGTMAVAGHTLWQRIDSILMTISLGIGASSGILGAQNLGARQPERAVKSGWLGSFFIAGIMLIISIVILLWAEKVVSIFNTEPELVRITSTFLRIAVAGNLAFGFNMVFMQFLTAVGDTMTALIIELIGNWLVQITLAFVLSSYTNLGVYGIRWAMVIGVAVAAVIFTIYFWLGRWKNLQV